MQGGELLSRGGIGGACLLGGNLLGCHQPGLGLGVHAVSDGAFLRGWEHPADSMRGRRLLRHDGEGHMRSVRGGDIPEPDGGDGV